MQKHITFFNIFDIFTILTFTVSSYCVGLLPIIALTNSQNTTKEIRLWILLIGITCHVCITMFYLYRYYKRNQFQHILMTKTHIEDAFVYQFDASNLRILCVPTIGIHLLLILFFVYL